VFQDWESVEKEQALSVLKKVLQLFKDKSKWIDGPVALGDGNLEIDPCSPSANKWSLLGAIDKFSYEEFATPQAGYVACAIRDYLNVIGKSNRIWKTYLPFRDEMKIVSDAIYKLSNEDKI